MNKVRNDLMINSNPVPPSYKYRIKFIAGLIKKRNDIKKKYHYLSKSKLSILGNLKAYFLKRKLIDEINNLTRSIKNLYANVKSIMLKTKHKLV